jgi:Na+-transporting NADH:ubiquinone oxidoreductase subunit NqrC
MPGFQQRKIFCQALRRRDKQPCQAKGFLTANGKYLCRFHGYNNIKGFNKPKYTDDKRINQLQALYQFRNKSREEVEEYYYREVKPRIRDNQKSRYFHKQSYRRKNPYRMYKGQSNQSFTDQLDEVLLHLKKKSRSGR